MTPTTAETELTPELLERVTKLSPKSKDRLLDLLLEEIGPPDSRTDEEIAAEIKRRSDEYHAGTVKSLTREESDAIIRAEVRKLGVELP
jgi:putative addiction module component (TIGR02574 family)